MDEDLEDLEGLLPSYRHSCGRCELELTTVFRYLDGLSYENVNDVEVRASLRAARGFCNHHAWQYLDATHDSLGAAIIYRDVLGAILAELHTLAGEALVQRVLRQLTRAPLPLDRAISLTMQKLRSRIPCPACQALRVAVAERSGSTYLCLPHLRAAVVSGRLGGAALSAAWARSLRRLERLGSDEALDEGRRWRVGSRAQGPKGSLLDVAEAAFGKRGITRVPLEVPSSIVGTVQPVSVSADAFTQLTANEGCPVCTLVSREIAEVLAKPGQAFPERLAALIEADDLCNAHAWLALETVDGEAEARRHPLSSPYRQLLGRYQDASPPVFQCRACALQSQREADYCAGLSSLVSGWTSNHVDKAPSPLCLPHLLRALQLLPGDKAVTLVRRNVGAIQELRQELAEFIRRHDYRFRHELAGTEQTAPVRALELVAGVRWRVEI